MFLSAQTSTDRPDAPPHYFEDLYSFDWSAAALRLSVVGAAAVAVCLFAGILAGHPGAGLVAGGGAFTVGFGANQRISDSRVLPMLAAVFGTSTAALVGTLAGYRGYSLVIAAAASAAIYGVLTVRNTGLSWVAQQSSIALLVASAFEAGPKLALIRAGLLAAGGMVQVLIMSAGLCLVPELRKQLFAIPEVFLHAAERERREAPSQLEYLRMCWKSLVRSKAVRYAARLALTVALATELYHRLAIQSGYWIPMTALLVQKPAFAETFSRGLARVVGTVAGAGLCSILIAHVSPQPAVLAAATALFALLSYMFNPVNYGIFAAFLTGYIVFLLSLNQLPGPLIAHRRAWCTALGGLIALIIHLDALRRYRRNRVAGKIG